MLRMPCGVSILVVAFGLSGCGPSGPVFAPVSGTVTVDGKPLDDGTIYFKTVHEGSVDRMEVKEGKFDGMVEVGDRRVEVCRYREGKPFMMGSTPIPNRINTIDARYNTQSELTATVDEDGPNEFTFAVTSK